MLVNGRWTGDWQPVQASDDVGRFLRQGAQFRNRITPDGRPGPTGDGGFAAEPGRYRLFVALVCPWASRTLIVRALKGLSGVLPVTVLNSVLTDQGWRFGGGGRAGDDPLFGAGHLHELYARAKADYTGRATVPVLWDTATGRIVNNESADIIAMLDTAFAGQVPDTPSLRPADRVAAMDALSADMYDRLNNGVYKAGFATSQAAHDEAVDGVFACLADLEARMADGRPWLMGERLTEADVRLFVTAIRFDTAYHTLFRSNLRRLADHPHLWDHTARMLALPGVRATVDLDAIVAGYASIRAINPHGIVPHIPAHMAALMARVPAPADLTL